MLARAAVVVVVAMFLVGGNVASAAEHFDFTVNVVNVDTETETNVQGAALRAYFPLGASSFGLFAAIQREGYRSVGADYKKNLVGGIYGRLLAMKAQGNMTTGLWYGAGLGLELNEEKVVPVIEVVARKRLGSDIVAVEAKVGLSFRF